MKQKTNILFLLVLVVFFVLVGCERDNQPTITEFNALGNWTENGEVYTFTTNTTEKLAFSYAKGTTPDAFMESAAITQDLSIFKTLVISVKGTGSVLVRLKGTTTKEVRLNVTGISGTYEWNLMNSSDFLKNVTSIQIIGSPDKEESVGSIEITSLKFYTRTADGYIIQDGFNNIPDNINEYNGTDENFNFNAKWENFADETYTVTYEGTTAKVNFEKPAGKEWSALKSTVKGNFTKFKFMVLKVQGTSGQQIIVKPDEYNAFEAKKILNGNIQELVIDMRSMTTEQKNAIRYILIFGHAGQAGNGQFDIIEAYMTENYNYETPTIIKNIYNGTDSTFSIKNWYDFGDEVYTITTSGNDTILDYNKRTFSYALAASYIEGDISNFGKIEFVMTGAAGKKALLKIEGAGQQIEKIVDFDGTKQTFAFSTSGMTKAALQAVNKVMIFAAPGATDTTGSITIHSVTFMNDEFNFVKGWVDGGDSVYSYVDNNDNSVTVNYTKAAGQHWAFMKQEFETNSVAGYNTLTMVFSGSAGKSILVKPNDNGALEKTLTFDENGNASIEVTVDAFTKVIIFAEPNVENVTGSFTIVSAKLTYVMPELLDPSVDVNNDWVDSGDGVYAITKQLDGSVKVDYTKAAGMEWATMKQMFTGSLTQYNVFSIDLQGIPNKQVLVKVNNQIEQWLTFDGEGKASTSIKAANIVSVHLFGEGGQIANGTFTIVSATLSHELDVNNSWVDNGDNVYTFTTNSDKSVTVNYTKTAGKEWALMKQQFTNEQSMYNTFTIVLQGTVDKKVLVKLNNSLEKWVTFDAEGKGSVTVTLDQIMQVMLFAEGGEAASGSFTIVSAKLSYVAPIIKSAVEVPSNWTDNGDSVYTITTKTDGTIEVNYVKEAGKEWATMKQDFTGNLAGFNTFVINMKGTAGKQVLVKVNNAIESWVTFDANGDGFAKVSVYPINSVLLFAEGGQVASGTFTILSATLSYELNVNTKWVDNGDNVYTITNNSNGTVSVVYAKAAGKEWANMKQLFTDDFAKYNVFTIQLSGTTGKKVLVKINDSIEKWVTFDAEGKGNAIVNAASITSVHLFAEGGDVASGTFTIEKATLSFVTPKVSVITDPSVDVNNEWSDNGDSVYTITEQLDGSIKVDYVKVAGKEWATMKREFAGNFTLYNTFTIFLEGTPDKKVLVKINNSIEKWVTFDANGKGSAIIKASSMSSVLLFAEGGDVANGTFTIISATLSHELNVNSSWFDNGDDVYVITPNQDGTISVAYNKVAGKEWATMKREFSLEDAIYNTFSIALEGIEGKKVLVKLNNAVEKWLTFNNEGKASISVTLDKFTSVLLFAEGGDVANGTFTIKSAELSYVAPVIKETIDAPTTWVDNGDSVYTITVDASGDVVVNYVKAAGKEWATMKLDLIGIYEGYNTLYVTMTGVSGKKVLVKVNNSIESWVTFDANGNGSTKISVFPISSVLLFAEGGDVANGSFTITSMQLAYEVDVNKNWEDSGDEVYAITKNSNGSVSVIYTKVAGEEWATMRQMFVDDFAKYNVFKIVIEGTAGKQILVKVNNSTEFWVTLDANGKGSVTASGTKVTSVHLFAEGGLVSSGTFTISSATLSYVK